MGNLKLINRNNMYETAIDYLIKSIYSLDLRNVNLYSIMQILYNNNLYDHYIDIFFSRYNEIKTSEPQDYFNMILDNASHSLKNTNKGKKFFFNKINILYKNENFDIYLNLLLHGLIKYSSGRDSLDCGEYSQLLRSFNFIEKSKVRNNKDYLLVKLELLFKNSEYNDVLKLINKNLDLFKSNANTINVFSYLKISLLNVKTNATDYYSSALILYNHHKYEEFVEVISSNFNSLINDLPESTTNTMIKYYCDGIKKIINMFHNMSANSIKDLYLNIKLLLIKNETSLVLDLILYSNKFAHLIQDDIQYFKKELHPSEFDRILDYFYNYLSKIKTCSISNLNKIKILYENKRYSQCIELYDSDLHEYKFNIDLKDYNLAQKYYVKSYFKSKKPFSGLWLLVRLPFKYPTFTNVFTLLMFLSIIVCSVFLTDKYNLLYRAHILKPQIVEFETSIERNIIAISEKVKLETKILFKPDGIEEKDIKYTTNNLNIISIKSDGTVTGLEEGKAQILVILNDKETRIIDIEVKEPIVKEFIINIPEKEIFVGNKFSPIVELMMNYENATEPPIEYISSNPKIISIDGNNLTALTLGQSIITVSCGHISEEITITVVPQVISIHSDFNNIGLFVGDKINLNATITMNPSNALKNKIEYSSSDESKIKVSNKGTISAIGLGTETISIYAGDKIKNIIVSVTPKIIGIELPIKKMFLSLESSNRYGLITPIYTTIPANFVPASVVYHSSNYNIAEVSSTGVIFANNLGRTTISVTVGGKTASMEVIVDEPYVFYDYSVKMAVEEQLGTSGEIHLSQIENITELNFNNIDINSIEELHNFTSLNSITWKDSYGNNWSYSGNFENGKFHGNGSIQYNDLLLYEGEFYNGYEHGWGAFYFNNGDLLIGTFESGKILGPGSIYRAGGDIESGSWESHYYVRDLPFR